MISLQCPVRGCAQPLERRESSWECPSHHRFDIARSGYVNLLQPQDRKSLAAGDSREAIEARTSLLADGIGRAPIDAAAEIVAAVHPGRAATVVDLGCGSGELLGALAAASAIDGIGIDLSAIAAARAARAFPSLTWIVANADRRLPIADRSVEIVTSMHGRRNPEECARVLGPGGSLLVVVPAADDLIELRERVQGERIARDRTATVVAEHAPHFSLVSRTVARARHHLDRDRLAQLMRGTYRAGRTSAATAIERLPSLHVTLASELLLFRLN